MKGKQACQLCPHHCSPVEGKPGLCGIRIFSEGIWQTPYTGRVSAVATDPVEKKPLYHYYPGSTILSVGLWGCNMQCPFCQNWQISQEVSPKQQSYSVDSLLERVKSMGEDSIAFTYSEPVVHYEFLQEWSEKAVEQGIRTVLVTNGMLNRKFAKQLLPYIDACNVDLKSFISATYRNRLNGDLKTVQSFIETASEHCHIETTTLIVPEMNDSLKETEAMCRYLYEIRPDWIHHLSAYYPSFQYRVAPTSGDLLAKHLDRCREILDWVYPGNTELDPNSYCPDCGTLLVERRGYSSRIRAMKDGACLSCGKSLPFKVSPAG